MAEAEELLQKIQETSLNIKNYEILATSYILQSECKLKSNQIETSRKLEEKAEKLVALHNLSMKGRIIGDSWYRVGEYLWKQAQTDIEKAKILDK